MPHDLYAVSFCPDQQRLPILDQSAAPIFFGHALPVAEDLERSSVIPANKVVPGDGIDPRNWEAGHCRSALGADFKSDVGARRVRQVRAEEAEMHAVLATALGKQRRVPFTARIAGTQVNRELV